MKRSKEQVMPAITKELRKRIEKWPLTHGGYRTPERVIALVNDLISALEAAAPVADAVEWVEDYHGLLVTHGSIKEWELWIRGVRMAHAPTLAAAVAALAQRAGKGDA